MNSSYKDLKIEEVELDMNNPRIAKFIEIYDKDSLNSEQLALALGSGVEDSSQTNYNSLYQSIKTNKGIKQNLKITALLYVIGVVSGILIELIGIQF